MAREPRRTSRAFGRRPRAAAPLAHFRASGAVLAIAYEVAESARMSERAWSRARSRPASSISSSSSHSDSRRTGSKSRVIAAFSAAEKTQTVTRKALGGGTARTGCLPFGAPTAPEDGFVDSAMGVGRTARAGSTVFIGFSHRLLLPKCATNFSFLHTSRAPFWAFFCTKTSDTLCEGFCTQFGPRESFIEKPAEALHRVKHISSARLRRCPMSFQRGGAETRGIDLASWNHGHTERTSGLTREDL